MNLHGRDVHPCLLATATTASRTCRGGFSSARVIRLAGLNSSTGFPEGSSRRDLLASRPGDDVVPEGDAFGAKTLDLGLDVVHYELDPVPAARAGLRPVRHRPPRGAGRPAEQQAQVATEHVGERRCRVCSYSEAEMLRVELHGGIDVMNHVPHVDGAF